MSGFNATFAAVGDNGLDVYGATDVAIFTLTFLSTDTYLTNGYTLTAAKFGLSRPILAVEVIGLNTAALGTVWTWNTQTGALMGFWTGAGFSAVLAEIANTTTLSGFVLTVRVTTKR
jgi:hypothetical protein